MFNHAPDNYICPFCRIVHGSEYERISDIVYQDKVITALMAMHNWPNNPGNVIIIPNEHYENIYDLPVYLATRIHACSRAIALAMKAAYGCDGISTRQHNEPAGGQEVWHYHLHVFPRYKSDNLYITKGQFVEASKRAEYAQKLKTHLENWENVF